MLNARLDEAQDGIKTAGRNINNLLYADDNHPYGRKWRRTKEPVDESERTEWKAGLRLKRWSSKNKDHGIRSHHFMADGETMETVTDFIFWILSFTPTFSLSSFTFIKRLFSSSFTLIKRLFSSSSLSAIRVMSSAYLRLLIFLPAILIPSCASSSPAFCMMYSGYKLNKQGDNIQPWCTSFPSLNWSIVPCLVLTVASWPA